MSQPHLHPHPAQPLVVRLLVELFASGDLPRVAEIDVEPEYGYAARLLYRSGDVRLLRGTTLDVNPAGAAEIARDKGYTNYFLGRLGYRVPLGETFLLGHYVELIHRNLGRYRAARYRLAEDAPAYVRDVVGYPCYVKPNHGSQGRGVSRCAAEDEVRAALRHLDDQRSCVALVEAEVPLPDYRVVVLREDVIACYGRIPLRVVGDGRASVRELLEHEQARQEAMGRGTVIDREDPRIRARLGARNLDLDSVMPSGAAHQIYDISNLSAGGDAQDRLEELHPHWRELCIRLTRQMGLQLCGVDLACADLTDPTAAYAILEINPAPGLDHFAALGPRQAAVVRNLYRRLFNEG